MIEFLIGKERQDLISVVYGLPCLNTGGSSPRQWFASFDSLRQYKIAHPRLASNGAWVINKHECETEDVYQWWHRELKKADSMAKRLLKCAGVTVNMDEVTEGLRQNQGDAREATLNPQQRVVRPALRGSFRNFYSNFQNQNQGS